MRLESLPILCCPICRSALSPVTDPPGQDMRKGTLCCTGCGKKYTVQEGIPFFILPEELRGLNRACERIYSRISRFYDALPTRAYLRKYFWPAGGEDAARQEVISRLEIQPHSMLLETGIGTGANIPYLRRYPDIRLFGLDTSLGMLKQCRRNLKRWKLDAELIVGNAERLPFYHAAFDVVYHLGGINFFTRKREAIEEMIRVARPGTRMVIACESEQAIRINRIAIRLVFGKQLASTMLDFSSDAMAALVPKGMEYIRLSRIWEGNGYLLEFRKPSPRGLPVSRIGQD